MTMRYWFQKFALVLALLAVGSVSLASTATAMDVPESAHGESAVHDGDARVESRLIVDVDEVAAGDTFRVGVAFELDTDWHIYWQNPGDAGLPTDIHWESDEVEFGPLKWAAPGLFEEADGQIDSYGYEGEVVLVSEVEVAEEVDGDIEIEAFVDYLACSDACVEGHSELSRAVTVGDATTMAEQDVVELFDGAFDRVPRPASEVGLEASFDYSADPLDADDQFEAIVEIIECQEPGDECRRPELQYDKLEHSFLTDQYSDVDVETTGVASHPEAADGVVLKLVADWARGETTPEALISGVVEFELADGEMLPVHLRDELQIADGDQQIEAQAFPDFVEHIQWNSAESAPDDQDAMPDDTSLLWILLMAFAGGMLLNLMPCVFPVLALKVSAITKLAHEDRRSVVSHGMAYVFGIVGSMLVLAAAVIGLRVLGTEVGWGFQFQQPHFLAALIVILVLFALNLFGVFEVSVGSGSLQEKAEEASGLRRSAWEGVLAVVLATPCSAPFLGTAVGFALASNAATIIAVFAMLGLGLAAPMVVLTLVPGWAKVLPRPGDWMMHLKTFLGFALVGTAIWIVWLLGRQAGVDTMGLMLMFSGVLAMAAWIYGLVQFKPWSTKKVLSLALAVGLMGAASWLTFPIERSSSSAVEVDVDADIDWKPWSEDAVTDALDEGRPVFVNFTADWCLTCQVNKENAIETEEVYRAVDEYDVAMLEADWTDPDEDIREKLAEYNRAGIPYYLVYSPDNPDRAETLSEVISAGDLVEAFEEAASE